MKKVLFAALLSLVPAVAAAKVQVKEVELKDGAATLQGWLAWDDARTDRRPGVLVIHDWVGVSDHVKQRAVQLAEMGYVAFTADIYGKGVRPTDPKAAGAEAGKWRGDRAKLRARAEANLKFLASQKSVDPAKIVAIGFCFGGGTALELARSGAGLRGTVSFHGNLDTPNPADAKKIKGRILVLHGADDPHVGPEAVAAFTKEMRDAKVDWQLNAFGGAVHSFMVKAAGNDPSRGNAYDPRAEKRAWEDLRDFLAELFPENAEVLK